MLSGRACRHPTRLVNGPRPTRRGIGFHCEAVPNAAEASLTRMSMSASPGRALLLKRSFGNWVIVAHRERPVWARKAEQRPGLALTRFRPASAASRAWPMVSAQRLASSRALMLPQASSTGLRSWA